MPDTTAAIYAKSIVGAAAIAAIVALAILRIVPGPDAVAFVKWTIAVWMGSVAVTSDETTRGHGGGEVCG